MTTTVSTETTPDLSALLAQVAHATKSTTILKKIRVTDEHRANRLRWLNALQSDQYTQVKSVLQKVGDSCCAAGFCCLGVATELSNLPRKQRNGNIGYWFGPTQPAGPSGGNLIADEAAFRERYKNYGYTEAELLVHIENQYVTGVPTAEWFQKEFGVNRQFADYMISIGASLNDSHNVNFKQIAYVMSMMFQLNDAFFQDLSWQYEYEAKSTTVPIKAWYEPAKNVTLSNNVLNSIVLDTPIADSIGFASNQCSATDACGSKAASF